MNALRMAAVPSCSRCATSPPLLLLLLLVYGCPVACLAVLQRGGGTWF